MFLSKAKVRRLSGTCQEPTLADSLSGVPAVQDRQGDLHHLKISVTIQSYENASRRVRAGFLGDRSSASCDQSPGIRHARVGCGGKEPNIIRERH
jgi:hypothetical protein